MKVTPIGQRLYATKPGEEVELRDDQAAILIKVGRVRAVGAQRDAPPVTEEQYSATQQEEPAAATPVKRGPGRPRNAAASKAGTYKTRDMKAGTDGQSQS